MFEPKSYVAIACPSDTDVESWYHTLCAHAVSAEHSNIVVSTKAQVLWRIKEKNTTPEHEYFVAEVLHDDGKTRYLRIERFSEDYVPATDSKRFAVQASPLGGVTEDTCISVGAVNPRAVDERRRMKKALEGKRWAEKRNVNEEGKGGVDVVRGLERTCWVHDEDEDEDEDEDQDEGETSWPWRRKASASASASGVGHSRGTSVDMDTSISAAEREHNHERAREREQTSTGRYRDRDFLRVLERA
ncbi:hypothetical protein BU17DRAFT_72200 [Hysterangium stoloniferum]|nr:hypothetical protein BU17DRAFT_72200 [Hysterangium stoloniferum]